MTQIEKIDYMILALQLVKDEVDYANEYKKEKEKLGDNFYHYGNYGYNHRSPNGTIVRELLRMIGRIANQVANKCTLSQYCDELFIER